MIIFSEEFQVVISHSYRLRLQLLWVMCSQGMSGPLSVCSISWPNIESPSEANIPHTDYWLLGTQTDFWHFSTRHDGNGLYFERWFNDDSNLKDYLSASDAPWFQWHRYLTSKCHLQKSSAETHRYCYIPCHIPCFRSGYIVCGQKLTLISKHQIEK